MRNYKVVASLLRRERGDSVPSGPLCTLGSPRSHERRCVQPLWLQRAESAWTREQDIRDFHPRRVFLPSRNALFGVSRGLSWRGEVVVRTLWTRAGSPDNPSRHIGGVDTSVRPSLMVPELGGTGERRRGGKPGSRSGLRHLPGESELPRLWQQPHGPQAPQPTRLLTRSVGPAPDASRLELGRQTASCPTVPPFRSRRRVRLGKARSPLRLSPSLPPVCNWKDAP